MKTNTDPIGGSLRTDAYTAYASYLKAFADTLSNRGAPLYAVSLQNEPDASVTYESCSWNATQFLNFTKNNGAAVGTPIIMPESMNFNRSLSDSTLNDPDAVENISIIGGHLYGGGLSRYPLALSKGKEVWMTEHLVLDTIWSAVMGTAKEINDCMSADMSAYIWWYIVRYYGPIHEDSHVTKRGFVMSQYSKFIRPGFNRVKSTENPQASVYVTAYKNGSKVVIVAVNNGSSISQTFICPGGTMTVFTPYVTSSSKSCVEESDILFANSIFTVTLDASSVTTFVSN
jgi:glucuronoarabinoxylan endo-1,4-beta-xylanase